MIIIVVRYKVCFVVVLPFSTTNKILKELNFTINQ